MSESPLSNPLEELTNCQPLIEHALNHQRKELQIEQITIRVNALEDK